ncbi:MAG: ATP-binding protein [Deltaproteobacteria bacterium]|jgi:ABC-type ATPase involved in cell division|nr:ATP-binding protein [Deltaproteobacteria bacterium]
MQGKLQSPSFFTLHVENFGKITKADIELSPFTLFVGDNNSGKSYMLTLIYGLLSNHTDKLLLEGFELLYQDFFPLIQRFLKQEVNEYCFIKKEEIDLFTGIVNQILKLKKDDLSKVIFNKNIEIGTISLAFHYDEAKPISLCFVRARNGERQIILGSAGNPQIMEIDDNFINVSKVGTSRVLDVGKLQNLKELTPLLMLRLFRNLMLHGNFSGPAFLPTCRTGFVLTHKALYADSILKAYTIEGRKSMNNLFLTAPMLEFAMKLSTFSSFTGHNIAERNNLVHFMEEKLLGGTIELSSMPVADLLYRPYGLAKALPMHVASAIVTETAPLLLYIQKVAATCLLIEEPEMCLHPKLQQVMARVLIKTMNSGYYGIPVIASTHSDIIVQHVSNMSYLSLRPDRKQLMSEFGYDEDDLLEPENVRIYQFDDKGIYSEVTPILWNTENGYVVSTFIDALGSILQHTIEITSED